MTRRNAADHGVAKVGVAGSNPVVRSIRIARRCSRAGAAIDEVTLRPDLVLFDGRRRHGGLTPWTHVIPSTRGVPVKSKLAAVSLIAVLFAALPAPALAAVRITRAQYDSPGSDTGSNSSLNAEYVVLKNTGNRAMSLTGWTLRDTAGHVYRFGTFKLRAGRAVTVHTGSGGNTGGHRYWDADGYVWNNDGDRATLKNRSGSVIDRCSWSGGSTATSC